MHSGMKFIKTTLKQQYNQQMDSIVQIRNKSLSFARWSNSTGNETLAASFSPVRKLLVLKNARSINNVNDRIQNIA
jgi:hypothetical protein